MPFSSCHGLPACACAAYLGLMELSEHVHVHVPHISTQLLQTAKKRQQQLRVMVQLCGTTSLDAKQRDEECQHAAWAISPRQQVDIYTAGGHCALCKIAAVPVSNLG